MAHTATGSVVRQLESLFEAGSVAGLSDRQLLERYITGGRNPAGEAAFAALVERHGPMVLGVCRQLLGDAQHAEDAFQAVFLVLAQKARSIRDPDLLGNWLYGVALRTARCAKQQIVHRRKREEGDTMKVSGPGSSTPADQPAIDREQAEAIHGEIDRLPRVFRLPLVLCYFEGLTLDEAARRLRCPAGTLRSRLARARDKLGRGLARRGVSLPVAALGAFLAPQSASASISPLLCDTTTRAATAFAARHAASGAISASATLLAQEVLRTMLFQKLRLTVLSLLFVSAVATGAGYVIRSTAKGDESESPPPSPVSAKSDPIIQRPAPGRMTVVGRVLDPQGKQVPGALVMVYGETKQGGRTDRPGAMAPSAIGQAASDGSGLFSLDAPRISSSTHHHVYAAAIAPGYGVGWLDLDHDADQPAADITLRPEQVIQGRLFDLQGQPVQGVRVSVEGMGHARQGTEPLPEDLDGPIFWGGAYAKTPPAWPRPAISDAEGRYTIHGIGQDLRVLLVAEDSRFAQQRIVVDTDSRTESKKVTMAMEPAKIFTGVVTYADTGRPVPHAVVAILAYRGGPGYSSRFETDAEGRFRANPQSTERYYLAVYSPEGQPYLNFGTGIFPWKKGALKHQIDVALSRGRSIHGKVTEAGTGKPIAGALLGFVERPARGGEAGAWNSGVQSGPDGSYQLAVLPKAGTIVVLGPSEDYVLQESSERIIREGQPGGRRWYAHAFIDCDLKSGNDTQAVDIALHRGMPLKARVIDPDGQLVKEAHVFSRAITLPQPSAWRHWWGEFHGNVRNGQCAFHGLAPNGEIPVYFLEPKRELGATAYLSGNAAANGPPTVRLEPCGTAKGRLVDSTGKPLAGYRDPYLVSMVVTPGPSLLSRDAADKGRPAADQDFLYRIDPAHYADGVIADANGRITLPALIPGATYRVYDRSQDDTIGLHLREEFVARTGEAIELGDIVIEKPK
ncbi:sigma-70 family RNA polymerase sigma factor [Singulisphaera sp. Ch08]|uniref:Sigma-70 family RNA polymerase sigma factor n=1 Tax=Singulisphaera sp. Ch08 TaxID=3120278 RepID=A0AAU7CMY0_9BACT